MPDPAWSGMDVVLANTWSEAIKGRGQRRQRTGATSKWTIMKSAAPFISAKDEAICHQRGGFADFFAFPDTSELKPRSALESSIAAGIRVLSSEVASQEVARVTKLIDDRMQHAMQTAVARIEEIVTQRVAEALRESQEIDKETSRIFAEVRALAAKREVAGVENILDKIDLDVLFGED